MSKASDDRKSGEAAKKIAPRQFDDEISLRRDAKEFLAGLRAEALEEDDHLKSEEIVAYVAGRLDEIDRVCTESHLECCELCSREARELRDWVVKTARPGRF